jgi:glucose/arabinose dehydrogenase
MTSRSPVRVASLLVAALVACGGAPATPSAPEPQPVVTEPTTGTAAADSAAAAAPAAVATALPKTPGPHVTPDGVVFNYRAQGKGKRIFLAGEFNKWNPSDDNYLLKDDDGDGIWTIVVKLKPGSHQYKYVIDGAWTKDPFSPGSAPDGFGGQNGQLEVK